MAYCGRADWCRGSTNAFYRHLHLPRQCQRRAIAKRLRDRAFFVRDARRNYCDTRPRTPTPPLESRPLVRFTAFARNCVIATRIGIQRDFGWFLLSSIAQFTHFDRGSSNGRARFVNVNARHRLQYVDAMHGPKAICATDSGVAPVPQSVRCNTGLFRRRLDRRPNLQHAISQRDS